jgi:protein gp37
MGDTTEISWADKTFNPWIGCTNVSPACDHCYAESLAKRWAWAEWGPGKPRRRTSDANWCKPLSWDKKADRDGTRPRVFCASLADWADAEVPQEWRYDLFQMIMHTPHLDWLLLSKRHALILKWLDLYGVPRSNVRIGVTVEDDHHAKMRLPTLHKVKAAGYKTFVSYEPALGRVDWAPWMDCIDWLIAGGESGPGWRGPNPQWFYDARDACQKFDVPFHFKQWGACQEGHVLSGREWLEFPT